MIGDFRVANDFLEEMTMHPASPDELKSGKKCFYKWDKNDKFSSEKYTVNLEKKPGKDFVILNFADIQCHDTEAYSFVGDFYEETIDKLIKEVKPDLITLTGDNAFDAISYMKLINFIESYEIPWAPVMGNADQTGLVSEFWADYRLNQAKHCLFDYGPENMGDGNYIINITENGKTVHTLFMMDTHHEETMQVGSYDHLYDNQIEWYKWAVKGICAEAGKTVSSSVFFHIPVPEIQDAWDSVYDYEKQELKGEYKNQPFCKMHEKNGAPLFNNGFFETCVELGSTKNIICGHDHKNCFSIPYKGINLTYGMKTGNGCYWERETNGGTVIKIDSEGNTKTDFCYIDPSKTKVKRFLLEYYGVNLYEPNLEGYDE